MTRRRLVRTAVMLLLTAVFVYFFVKGVDDWREAVLFLKDVRWGLFALVVLLTPLHLATRGLRWKYLIMHEAPGVRYAHLFNGNAIGFMVSAVFPGRLGELVKPLYLARKEGCRPGFAIGTIVVERTFDIFTMCALLAVFLLLAPLLGTPLRAGAEADAKLYFWGALAFVFASVLLVLCVLFYVFKERALRIAERALRLLPARLRGPVLRLLREFIDGLKFFHSLGNLAVYVGLSFVVWLGIVLFYWIFLAALDLPLPFPSIVPYVFLTAVGASIPTPGMVGGFHAFSRLGLTALFGVAVSRAAGLTIVLHLVQFVMTCLIGYVIVGREGLSLLQLKRLGEAAEP